ncbi:MAG: hypothetical protein AAF401_07545 [Pseudomonadota bacterium]
MKHVSISLVLGALLANSASAASIGYFRADVPGLNNFPAKSQAVATVDASPDYELSITEIFGLNGFALQGFDILWIRNVNTGAPDFSQSVVGDIASFVSNGGVLLVNDWGVTNVGNWLPGGGSTGFVRDVNTPERDEISLTDPSSPIADGPFGVLDNNSLDDLGASSHGYAELSTLPQGSQAYLTRTDPTHVVDFGYEFGDGDVYYSTMPTGFHLSGHAEVRDIYLPNVLAFAADLSAENLGGGAAEVPLPAPFILLASGLGGLLLLRSRQQQKSA